ncbi:DUF4180 domain-containing protein [Paenibacillus daejeonensis]|uniref:DUF4180 domain-containing protein n=1 Tax=Paenibacillus daejeonensis TaxID=135193 RepID=UPI00036FBA38|nr:DUF4180 domain-containing protein [Paenibacillus daejeonensis]
MEVIKVETEGQPVAVVRSWPDIIDDVQTALDLMATVQYETGCDRIVIPQALFSARFYDLSTKLAGDILQKYTNYGTKLAIVGDFSQLTSKSLRDFIYECNHGRQFAFLPTEQDAIHKLGAL